MNKYYLWFVALGLVAFGLLQPHLSVTNNSPANTPIVVVTKPSDAALVDACADVINILKNSGSSRTTDGTRLSELYCDIARLIELDGENTVIKTTEEIKQANSLSGLMLRMDLKGKYPNLAEAAKKVIVAGVGDDATILDANLRQKAVESFMALAWACNEGAK